MKTWKLIDMILQAGLFLAGLAAFGAAGKGSPDLYIFFYFYLGGWQLFSFLLHKFFFRSIPGTGGRNVYGRIILYLFATTLLLLILFILIKELFFLILLFCFALLFISPFLALYYFLICWKEYGLTNKREFIHLKN